MIQKIRGIVLHSIPYGETSIIVHLYTDAYGRQSIMVKGARGQRKNRKISLYHPLALLELEYTHKENRDLQTIREAKPITPLQGIIADPLKNVISLFLAEVLYRCLRESESNHELFEYLSQHIQFFDLMTDGVPNFHLYLLTQLTRFLGFRPHSPAEGQRIWFDLITGSFQDAQPLHPHYIAPSEASYLIRILGSTIGDLADLKIPRSTRNELIESLLEYYHQQMDGMSEVKSYKVLKAVFQ